MANRTTSRPYPPDYVSAETLAYRLDMSRSKVYADVKRGLLPQPVMVGDSPRWRWSEVEKFISRQNGLDSSVDVQCDMNTEEDDPYLRGVDLVAT